MNEEKLDELIEELFSLAEDCDSESILSFLDACKADGYLLDLEQDEDIEWSQEGDYEEATVTVNCTITFGSKVISEWTSQYMGLYGGGNTGGWWVTEVYNDISDDAQAIIEAVFIRLKFPDVPEPRKIIN